MGFFFYLNLACNIVAIICFFAAGYATLKERTIFRLSGVQILLLGWAVYFVALSALILE